MNKMVDEDYNKKTFDEFHKVQLEILRDFIKVCNKYAIPYFAVNSLAAGAIRYQGFVPGQKEVDVGMLRKDFDRFGEVFEKELSEQYRLLTPESNDHFTHVIPRLQKKETGELQDSNRISQLESDNFINLIPFDYVAMEKKEKRKQRYKTKFWKKLMVCCNMNEMYLSRKNELFIKEYVGCIMMHIILKMLHIRPADVYINYVKAASGADSNSRKGHYLADFAQGGRKFDRINKREVFPTKDLPFESIMIRVPGNIEKYVSETCSEYLK